MRTRSFIFQATQIKNHTGFGYVRGAGAACGTVAGTFRICGNPTYAPTLPRCGGGGGGGSIAPPFNNTATVHQYRSPLPVHTRTEYRYATAD
jgi:hypothetical protein